MNLTDTVFTDKNAAREHLEAIRWPDGPVCPHCGVAEESAKVEGRKKSHRPGLYYCNACSGQFTVTVGTVMERSKVPLNKWVLAFHLYASSKKGISAHQLHRSIGVTYKTAWFMAHRIREAMRNDDTSPMGSGGGVVEADETFIGKDPKMMRYYDKSKKIGIRQKMKVLALVDRETGQARTQVIDHLSQRDIAPLVRENVAKEARFSTDEASYYRALGQEFSEHMSVNHSAGEYGRGEAHVNTLEGYFSIFKRGMKGVYQHCSKQHLHRYAAEFEFRYNHRAALEIGDTMRATTLIKGAEDKRLTYRSPNAGLI